MIDAKDIIKRFQAMETKRAPWDALWNDIRKLVDPTARTISAGGLADQEVADRYDVARLLDTTLSQSVQITANGQLSHVTPVGEQWFSFDPPQNMKDDSLGEWYSKSTETAQQEIAKSNFYDVVHEDYLNRTSYGIGCLYVGWSDKLDGLIFKEIPVGTYCVEEDDEGHVDTVFYRFNMTPRQAVQQFGDDLPPEILRDSQKADKQDVLTPFIHAVFPNTDRQPGREDNQNMAYVSAYVSEKHKKVVRVSGFDSLPFLVSRWIKWGDSAYGVGAGMFAMPTAKQANFLEAMADYACEKITNPPVLIPAGYKYDIDSTPGGQTFFDPSGKDNAPREWQTTSGYQVDKDRLADKREVIENICFVPLFRTITEQSKQMTAREVQERVGEQLTMFHPIFARLTVEMLTPMLKRVLALLIEHGKINPPVSLEVRKEKGSSFASIPDPDIQYSSRVALALKEQQSAGFYSMMELLTQIANVSPGVLKIPNFEQAFRDIARIRCTPERWLHTPEEIEELEKQEQEAAAAAQAPEQLAKMSQAVKNVGGPEAAEQMLQQ